MMMTMMMWCLHGGVFSGDSIYGLSFYFEKTFPLATLVWPMAYSTLVWQIILKRCGTPARILIWCAFELSLDVGKLNHTEITLHLAREFELETLQSW